MSLLIIGLVATVSLVIVPSIMLNFIEHVRNRSVVQRDGVRVKAIVIDVQVKRGWKYGEGWYRDSWSGDLKRQKAWQTYYHVTAQWVDPQKGQTLISSTRIWLDKSTSKPVEGDAGIIWFDPKNLKRSCLVLPTITERGTKGMS